MANKRKKAFDPALASYKVGKNKPPIEHQFTNGHQINLGRKRAAKAKTFDDILNEKVEVPRNNGSVVRMTNREVIYRQTIAQARKGSPRHILIALEHDRRKEAGESNLDPLSYDAELRKEVLNDFADEIKANLEAAKDPNAAHEAVRPKGPKGPDDE